MCAYKRLHMFVELPCEGKMEVRKQTTEEPHHRIPPRQQEIRILSCVWERICSFPFWLGEACSAGSSPPYRLRGPLNCRPALLESCQWSGLCFLPKGFVNPFAYVFWLLLQSAESQLQTLIVNQLHLETQRTEALLGGWTSVHLNFVAIKLKYNLKILLSGEKQSLKRYIEKARICWYI